MPIEKMSKSYLWPRALIKRRWESSSAKNLSRRRSKSPSWSYMPSIVEVAGKKRSRWSSSLMTLRASSSASKTKTVTCFSSLQPLRSSNLTTPPQKACKKRPYTRSRTTWWTHQITECSASRRVSASCARSTIFYSWTLISHMSWISIPRRASEIFSTSSVRTTYSMWCQTRRTTSSVITCLWLILIILRASTPTWFTGQTSAILGSPTCRSLDVSLTAKMKVYLLWAILQKAWILIMSSYLTSRRSSFAIGSKHSISLSPQSEASFYQVWISSSSICKDVRSSISAKENPRWWKITTVRIDWWGRLDQYATSSLRSQITSTSSASSMKTVGSVFVTSMLMHLKRPILMKFTRSSFQNLLLESFWSSRVSSFASLWARLHNSSKSSQLLQSSSRCSSKWTKWTWLTT